MRSKGSRFILGVWGLRVCSLDVAFRVATVRNRSQPSATVRNRSRDCYMAVPMVSSAGGVIFGGFQGFVASFRVAGVALRDIQTCFVTCRKSFCVAGAIFLRRFQKMRFSSRGRRSTLAVSILILHGRRRAQHFRRVVLCAFCESHCQGCVKWRQGANSVAGVAFCVMCWKLAEASHKTSILRLQPPTCLVWSLWFSRGFAVSMGEAAKPVLLSCCQLWKLPEVSYEMLVFLHPRVLSPVAGFPVASPRLWGKLENISYWKMSKQVVMSFCVAGVALCDIPTCLIMCRKSQNWRKSRTKCWFFCIHVSSRWFSCGVTVSMGEAGKHLLFECAQAGCHVVLRGRRGTLWHSNPFDTVSNVKIEESLTRNARFFTPTCRLESLLFLWRRRVYGGSSALHTLHFTLHTPQFAL